MPYFSSPANANYWRCECQLKVKMCWIYNFISEDKKKVNRYRWGNRKLSSNSQNSNHQSYRFFRTDHLFSCNRGTVISSPTHKSTCLLITHIWQEGVCIPVCRYVWLNFNFLIKVCFSSLGPSVGTALRASRPWRTSNHFSCPVSEFRSRFLTSGFYPDCVK